MPFRESGSCAEARWLCANSPEFSVPNVSRNHSGIATTPKGELNRLSRSGIQKVDYVYNTVEELIWDIQGGTNKRRMSGLSRWPPSVFASADLKVSASPM